MTIRSTLIVLAVACLAGAVRASDVSTPSKRMVTVDLARSLLTVPPVTQTAEEISGSNPFVTKREVVTRAAEPAPTAAIVSDRDLLSKLAATVSPSGTIILGDRTLLLVGQKRLKVGDTLSIVFQGQAHQVEISAIDRISFTLRLNKEEITRPIK